MRKLFHTTVVIGFSQVLIILLQIIRAKLVALLIGPAGVGVIGNTYAFISVLENICFLGFHTALLRYASEKISEKKYEETGRLLSTAFFIHIFISSLGIVIALLFLQKINISIYQNLNFLFVSIFALLAVPFAILYSDLANLFNAFNEVKILAKLNIFPAIISLCSIVPLIIIFGLKGAIITIFVESLLMFLVGFYFYRRYFADRIKIKKSFFSKELALKMFKYGSAFQIAIIINSVAAYFLKVMVTTKLLLAGAGIFNAALSIGGYLLMLQTPLGIYLYPKISSIYKDGQETKTEINQMLRFFLILLTPIIICVLLFSDIVIKLLLSKAFLAVGSILLWILIARFFEVLQYLIGLPLFIMGRFKTYLGIVTTFNIVLVGLSYIFFKKFDLLGVAIAQSISYALLFILYFVAARRTFNFKFEWNNIFYIISALCLFIMTNYFRNYDLVHRVIPLLITLFWLILVIKKREWVALGNYLKEHWPFSRQKI